MRCGIACRNHSCHWLCRGFLFCLRHEPQTVRHSLIVLGLLLSGISLPRAVAGEPSPPPPRRPNILLAIADDWGFGHAGAYGCKWVRTPAFDRVAREGILFRNCFTSNPKCSPSRASLLTGRNTWQLEEASCHFGSFAAHWPVYPDLLERAGYRVGFTGKGWGPGDWQSGGRKQNPAGPGFGRQRSSKTARGVSTNDYAANFADFLRGRAPGQSFCFWSGCEEPHRPYDEGAGVRAGRRLSEIELPSYYPDSPVVRSDLLDYALEVESFDRQLGRMLAELERTGELDNTIVVVTSDNGLPFPRAKGQIYDAGFHLPLAIRWGRRVAGGRTVDDFVNFRDLAPTFLILAGVAVPKTMTGRDIVDVLESRAAGWVDRTRNRMLVGKEKDDLGRPSDLGYPVRGLRTPDYLYVRNFAPDRWPVCNPETGYSNCDNSPTKTLMLSAFDERYRLSFGRRPAEELYRLADDRECARNLAADPQMAAIKEQLAEEMTQALRREGDPRILGNGAIFDTYRYTGRRDHAYDRWLKFRQ